MVIKLSIVIPAYNEEKNVTELYNRLTPVLKKLKMNYEIIFIDDGSEDKTFSNLLKLHKRDKHVKIIKFRRNFGQTAAIDAGFKHACGEVIIVMDSDLQNDPKDIPRLLKKLNEGYDIVSGWRYKRKDKRSKKIISILANFFRRLITKEQIHDSGCSLKAYRRECLNNLNLYGDSHRFIPAILKLRGFKIGEIKVKHHYRKHGKPKYGLLRILHGFFDIVNISFWEKYSTKPLHFFGGLAILNFAIGFLIFFYKFFIQFLILNQPLDVGPLLLASVLFILIGIQLMCFGFLGEMQIRTYYTLTNQVNYEIEKVVG